MSPSPDYSYSSSSDSDSDIELMLPSFSEKPIRMERSGCLPRSSRLRSFLYIAIVLLCLAFSFNVVFVDRNGGVVPEAPSPVVSEPQVPETKVEASPPPPEVQPSTSQSKYTPSVAIVIETSITQNLIPVMLHFHTVLGPDWKIILFTLEGTYSPPISPAFRRAVAAGNIEVRFLPDGIDFTVSQEVSNFLARPWLWEQFEDAERVLMFQTDSILCSNSGARVDDFLEWDLIGAPIAENFGQGYNGGLSLRNPRALLEIIRDESVKIEGFEDQWFYKQLKERGAKLPEPEIAKRFSVETIWEDRPLGYHQPGRYMPDKIKEIEEWCPEVRMLVGRRST